MADIVLRPAVEQADTEAVRDAYRKMQAFTPTDNRSWVYWSAFHGFNRYDCWHHGRVGPGRGTQFEYDLFLPWHRAYLVSFDHAVRDQDAGAILAWWDWTSASAHEVGVPLSYQEDDASDNPLATGVLPAIGGDPPRRTKRFPGDPAELPFMDRPNPAVGLPSVESILELSQFVDFSNQLQNVHDFIHGWTGGTNPENPDEGGDMGSIAVSAFDPIFWAHHAMIDRLWYLWQLKWGVNNVPADYLDKVLAPFPFTVRDVLDVRELGYDYAVSATVATVAPSTTGSHSA